MSVFPNTSLYRSSHPGRDAASIQANAHHTRLGAPSRNVRLLSSAHEECSAMPAASREKGKLLTFPQFGRLGRPVLPVD